MKVTIEPMLGNEYWINFQEPENDNTPYVRIFNKNFSLEQRGLNHKFILLPDSDFAVGIMMDLYNKPSILRVTSDMIDAIEKVIRRFFKDAYKKEFRPTVYDDL